ncbi:DNA polymerase-3 subunit epsilon [Bradyrhizobium sp. JR1.7]|uniref:3'-5' exonuclease n=1 Tax=unclassified Bradyrhizobium TaxID=2631580 RepID=UPI0033994797
MPGYIVIDVETSGLYIYKNADGTPHPADAPDQPRLAELAMIFCDDDFNVESEYQAYIKPDGWVMDPAASEANGILTDFLHEHGVPVKEVLASYSAAILDGRIVVAQNAQFDCKSMRGELRREGFDDLFEQTANICTMRSAMKLVPKVKKLNGKGGFPGLVDVAAHFGIEIGKQHSALDDARAAVEVAKRLKEAGVLLAPDVHRAKNHPSNEPVEA